MRVPVIKYKCGHTVPMLTAPDTALMRIAGGCPVTTGLVASDHPTILPDIALKLLQERVQ